MPKEFSTLFGLKPAAFAGTLGPKYNVFGYMDS